MERRKEKKKGGRVKEGRRKGREKGGKGGRKKRKKLDLQQV
jgi:hypothetical protein